MGVPDNDILDLLTGAGRANGSAARALALSQFAQSTPEQQDDVSNRQAAMTGDAQRRAQLGMIMQSAGDVHTRMLGKAAESLGQHDEDLSIKYGPEQRQMMLQKAATAAYGKYANTQQQGDNAMDKQSLANVGNYVTQGAALDSKESIANAQNASRERIGAGHDAVPRGHQGIPGDDDKDLQKLHSNIDTYKNPKLNILQTSIDRGDAITQLITQGMEHSGLTETMMVEAATGMARMITGSGRVAQEQIEHLIPKTFWQSGEKLWGYLTNHPQVLSNADFASIMQTSVDREKKMYQGKIHDAQVLGASSSAHLIRTSADAQRMLRQRGIDPDEVLGGYAAPVTAHQSVSHGKPDPAVAAHIPEYDPVTGTVK